MAHIKGTMALTKCNMAHIKGNMALTKGSMVNFLEVFISDVVVPLRNAWGGGGGGREGATPPPPPTNLHHNFVHCTININTGLKITLQFT